MIVTTITMTCDLCGKAVPPGAWHTTMRVEEHYEGDLVYRPDGGVRTYVACVDCKRFLDIGLRQLPSLRNAILKREAQDDRRA